MIKGATPSSTDAKESSYDPATNLVFPKYIPTFTGNGTPNTTAFKKILTANPDTDSNIGLVFVDINRAGIKFIGSNKTVSEGGSATNKNIVVFGVRQNNVSTPDSSVPDVTYQNAWQRWPYRFEANIKISAVENILVANNRLNDAITDNFEQNGYKIKGQSAYGDANTVTALTNAGQATYGYSDIGTNLDVNCVSGDNSTWYSTKASEPGSYRLGVVLRDNWMYGTKTTAIHASGEGMIIKGNIRKDAGSSKYVWTEPTGKKKSQGPDFNRNRGWDVGGKNILVEENDFEVYNHIIGWKTQYRNNDGESTWDQRGTVVDGFTCRNNILRGGTVIQIYRSQNINNVLITGNQVKSDSRFGNGNSNSRSIHVWSDTSSPFAINNTRVEDNEVNEDIEFKAGVAGSGNTIKDNTNVKGTGKILYSCVTNASISGNVGFTVDACKSSSSARIATPADVYNESANEGIFVYPNPTMGDVSINLPVNASANVSIRNSLGENVYHQEAMKNGSVMNTDHLAPGLYFVTIQIDGLVTIQKLIVRNVK